MLYKWNYIIFWGWRSSHGIIPWRVNQVAVETLPSYYHMETEVQIPHFASVDTYSAG